jgi:hypothetical protein
VAFGPARANGNSRAAGRVEAGPASLIAFAEPTNRPAPMMPAIEIIVMCLDFSLVPSSAFTNDFRSLGRTEADLQIDVVS